MAQASPKRVDRTPMSHQVRRGVREGALFIFGFTAIYFLVSLATYHPAACVSATRDDLGPLSKVLQHADLVRHGGARAG